MENSYAKFIVYIIFNSYAFCVSSFCLFGSQEEVDRKR
ncbi:hypothetical protein RV15_GL001910 [Enterococcus silesiacus]|uniref:Uncharacterized protein n=1 Tax=Enterococcus silesiacus TaxID=332949 RepID=A0AA91GFN6_9ENTE|nr:hypothetical protein RV15_GL001910 [Enterococcus silesiacus]